MQVVLTTSLHDGSPWVVEIDCVWCVWNMFDACAQDFVNAVRVLKDITLKLSSIMHEIPNLDWARHKMDSAVTIGFVEQLKEFEAICRMMGARASADSAMRFLQMLEQPLTAMHIMTMAEATSSAFYDEMASWRLLILNDREAEVFKGSIELIGNDVIGKFRDVRYDLDEACKCIATGRSTACVFHLMRVMEVVVRAWAEKLDIEPARLNPSGTRFRDLTWADLQREIRAAIERLPQTSMAERETRRGADIALATLDSVRSAWRNPTMHPAAIYTESQANAIFRFVADLLPELSRFV